MTHTDDVDEISRLHESKPRSTARIVIVRAWIAASVLALHGAAYAEPTASCADAVKDGELARSVAPTFNPGHASLTDDGKLALQPIAAALHARPHLRVAITGHVTADIRSAGDDTSKRRAEVAKWFLVDSGVEADRISTSVSWARCPSVRSRSRSRAMNPPAKRPLRTSRSHV